jgi:hypothetical protein
MATRVSNKIRVELLFHRARGVRSYEIARQANVHPTILSNLINGALPIKAGDPRVVRIGAALGITAGECFEGSDSDEEPRR